MAPRPPQISLIKLVRHAKGEGLAAAKNDVEGLVDGRPIDVHFNDVDAAKAFLRQAEAMGALGHMTETSDPMPFRDLTPYERALVQKLLSEDFPGREHLRAQIERALVEPLDRISGR